MLVTIWVIINRYRPDILNVWNIAYDIPKIAGRMDRNGIDYREIEARGYMLAVVSVECRYRSPAKYGETVEIVTRLKSFNGARVVYEYEARREDGSVCVTGHSEHCFISAATRGPVNIRRVLPEYAQKMFDMVET